MNACLHNLSLSLSLSAFQFSPLFLIHTHTHTHTQNGMYTAPRWQASNNIVSNDAAWRERMRMMVCIYIKSNTFLIDFVDQ